MTVSAKSAMTLSIVSHGQGDLVRLLLEDLRRLAVPDLSLILTLNIPEDEAWIPQSEKLPVQIIRNARPLGFGANHNQAFAQSDDEIFIVANPDLRLKDASFADLSRGLADPQVAACAPLVLGPDGSVQDSARRFPSLAKLAHRVLLRQRNADYPPDATAEVDWVAGMLVLFRSAAFRQIGGFDERYFMYLEDADICRRLHAAGWKVMYRPCATVVHDARRNSHRSLRHLSWHVRSMARFLCGV